MRSRLRGRAALILVGLAALVAYQIGTRARPPAGAPEPPSTTGRDATGPADGEARVLAAFGDRRSGVVVELTGTVDRTLADDDQGSRHQRFLIRLPGGHTLLVSHNIDLAQRVPIQRGDQLRLRGQYEWNDRGGVLHWTHHDPAGRRPGGWIELRGRTYR